ncbi:MAG: hypothetical protein PHN55_15025, partial [Dysgonamonadaceae bacterium]|nr:hypothetical protein [Dysgonamonadaceae bacterium]
MKKIFYILTVAFMTMAAIFFIACSSEEIIEDIQDDKPTDGTYNKETAFKDHGVASPISNHRGTVATIDGNGNNVVLIWLFDYTG